MGKTYGEKPIMFRFEENGEEFMIGSEVKKYRTTLFTSFFCIFIPLLVFWWVPRLQILFTGTSFYFRLFLSVVNELNLLWYPYLIHPRLDDDFLNRFYAP
jgi:hypothetical protein